MAKMCHSLGKSNQCTRGVTDPAWCTYCDDIESGKSSPMSTEKLRLRKKGSGKGKLLATKGVGGMVVPDSVVLEQHNKIGTMDPRPEARAEFPITGIAAYQFRPMLDMDGQASTSYSSSFIARFSNRCVCGTQLSKGASMVHRLPQYWLYRYSPSVVPGNVYFLNEKANFMCGHCANMVHELMQTFCTIDPTTFKTPDGKFLVLSGGLKNAGEAELELSFNTGPVYIRLVSDKPDIESRGTTYIRARMELRRHV